MMQNSSKKEAQPESSEEFEEQKRRYFTRLGLSAREELKLHKTYGLWGKEKEDWRRVTKHSLVVGARCGAGADILGLSPVIRNTLEHAGAVHDFHKKEEIRMVQEAKDARSSQWDAMLAAGREAHGILFRTKIDPDVIELVDILGNVGIKTADSILKKETLSEQDLARLILHYIDGMTMETDWSEPAFISSQTRTWINALDLRVDELETKPQYDGHNEAGREFFGGETTFEALRWVCHLIEQRLTEEMFKRTGRRIHPIEFPMAIDDHLRAITTVQAAEEKFRELESVLHTAGQKVLEMREAGLTATQKSHNVVDVVTEADVESERRITEAIRHLFPDHAIEGEEGTAEKGDSRYKWYIDPIDGTKPFREGYSFGISAGLTFQGRPLFGMIWYPAEGKLLKATRGQGATLNGQPLRSFREQSLVESPVGFDHSSSGDYEEEQRWREPLEARALSVKEHWCATKAVLDILERKAGAYVCAGATPYDIAAATVIAEEAGCVYSPMEGPLHFSNPFTPIVFASSPALLSEILALYDLPQKDK